MRIAAERLRREYARLTGASNPGVSRLYELVVGAMIVPFAETVTHAVAAAGIGPGLAVVMGLDRLLQASGNGSVRVTDITDYPLPERGAGARRGMTRQRVDQAAHGGNGKGRARFLFGQRLGDNPALRAGDKGNFRFIDGARMRRFRC